MKKEPHPESVEEAHGVERVLDPLAQAVAHRGQAAGVVVLATQPQPVGLDNEKAL